ncbi:hypothetical protein [Sphingomonas jeddahensis]|uniref:Uncharacterized protein n=1 Tax=Sphingomonas jeddahensis TaxID=1915074 RepID=A0A1V2EQV3_9SPHN|nr:hypothetical protein [Sphingomonas jeddahensis]ONF95061.1 hypothetical protein SPHI_27640 [Sphingomonas jeddahensis]
MKGAGRPLRFMVGLIGLWVGARILMLWPADDAIAAEADTPVAPMLAAVVGTLPVARDAIAMPVAIRRADRAASRPAAMKRDDVPIPSTTHGATSGRLPGEGGNLVVKAGAVDRVRRMAVSKLYPSPGRGGGGSRANRSSPQSLVSPRAYSLPPAPGSRKQASLVDSAVQARSAIAPGPQASPPPGVPLPSPAPTPSRFAGSGWLIARRGGAVPFAPQLGGSQAGARLTYALDPARRLSLAGRISTALASRQTEAAIGLDWKPTALPVHVIAEQRIGIDRARGGPSLGLVGGFGPTPLIGRWQLDGYGQGGAIVRDGVEGYADGALRLSYPLLTVGRTRLELGLGAWGAAQRGAARLDAGPAAAAIVPIAGRSFRLSLEWRQRLAGRATPASGPALSIGTDF